MRFLICFAAIGIPRFAKNAQDRYNSITMPNFPPVEEQLAYIKKGAAEIIHERELRERLEQLSQDRQADAREGRL